MVLLSGGKTLNKYKVHDTLSNTSLVVVLLYTIKNQVKERKYVINAKPKAKPGHKGKAKGSVTSQAAFPNGPQLGPSGAQLCPTGAHMECCLGWQII